MNRIVRNIFGVATFVGVSVLSAAQEGPRVSLGVDDAMADEDDDDTEHSIACLRGCADKLPEDCKSRNGDTCMQKLGGCACNPGVLHGKACSPSAPCAKTATSKFGCVNGFCMAQCATDQDCEAAGGGLCKGNTCFRRTPEEVRSCMAACAGCRAHLAECASKMRSCLRTC